MSRSFLNSRTLIVKNLIFRQKEKPKRPQPNAKNAKNKKSFKCMHCEKSFTQSKGLVIHIRSHTGEKPYFVFIAPRAFPVQNPFENTPGFTLEKRTIIVRNVLNHSLDQASIVSI